MMTQFFYTSSFRPSFYNSFFFYCGFREKEKCYSKVSVAIVCQMVKWCEGRVVFDEARDLFGSRSTGQR